MRQIKIIATSGSEIVSTSSAKAYLRVDFSDDDTLIERMITQARIWCENYISRDIVAKTRVYYLPSTNGTFDLPFAPVDSITHVKIDSVVATYNVLGLNNETIELNAGESEKVEVRYITLGMSDDLLKNAILQLVASYYENRGDFMVGSTVNEVPTNVKSILASLKSMYI